MIITGLVPSKMEHYSVESISKRLRSEKNPYGGSIYLCTNPTDISRKHKLIGKFISMVEKQDENGNKYAMIHFEPMKDTEYYMSDLYARDMEKPYTKSFVLTGGTYALTLGRSGKFAMSVSCVPNKQETT